MSGEGTPILCGTIPAFETFMTMWESLVNSHEGQFVATYAQAGLEWAYNYYARMDRTQAYIVTMCKCFCLCLPISNN